MKVSRTEDRLSYQTHLAKVQKYEQGKIGIHFFTCFANNAVEHYGKRIKILHGCLLRTDLTGHSHPSPFCPNGCDGHALLGPPPSKRHPCRILIIFPGCSTALSTTMRTNLPKLLDLLIFCIYLLNFSLDFFYHIFFVTNQLNISKFLPTQIRKTLISY